MGQILAGMATSHAFAFVDPRDWDQHRESNRSGFQRRYDFEPPVHPRIAEEDDQTIHERYRRFERSLRHLGDAVQSLSPTALVIVGDDQNENYAEDCLPQIATYVGDSIEAQLRQTTETDAPAKQVVPYHRHLAQAILEYGVESGFDIAASYRLRFHRGLGHAFGPPLKYLNPELRIPIVCVSVNAIHTPAVAPSRCLEFGRTLRRAILQSDDRVVVYGSGGLSHFTAGFPYKALGTFRYGEIDSEFDRRLLQAISSGDDSFLESLTSRDLLEHGDIEFRSWLVVHGAMGGGKAEILAYEPCYRAIMGLGSAFWPQGSPEQAGEPAASAAR